VRTVTGGGSVVSTLIGSGGQLLVSSGGIASGTTVSWGGVEVVGAGGSAAADTLDAFGLEIVASGGVIDGATVAGNAAILVLSGGSAIATSLQGIDSLLIVLNGGVAIGVGGSGQVVSGNPVVLFNASTASGQGSSKSGQAVTRQELQLVASGGSAQGTVVSVGGFQMLIGGTASGTVLSSGGVQDVYSGAASSTQVADQTQQVLYGGSAVGTVLSGGGAIQVLDGGVASGTQLTALAGQFLYAGSAEATVASDGGTQYVYNGTATSTLVGSASRQVISGGTAISANIEAGAEQEVFATTASATQLAGTQYLLGGTASFTEVLGGGQQLVHSGTASGSLLIDGGVEIVGSAGSAAGTQTIEAGAMVVSSGASVGGAIDFVGSGGMLTLASGATLSATVSGFSAGNTIDLSGLAYATGGSATLSGSALSVSDGSATQAITVDPTGLTGTTFYLSSDGSGGTDVTPCFAAGTRIGTARGDVAVEALRPGDLVHLVAGGTTEVVWLGHRKVRPRGSSRAADLQPVRVAAHAFGLGRPCRDLRLSPDHAVFCDGVLIPVRYLLNGATLRQDDVACVTYWHVELAAHAVLLAEGLPCESYLDTGNRSAFANGGAVVAAVPAFARAVWDRAGCAPLVTAGPARDLVYRRLLAQAQAIGWRTTDAGAGAVIWVAPQAGAA
jgi:autotransporter passenger strand-loop-strand repeat protein